MANPVNSQEMNSMKDTANKLKTFANTEDKIRVFTAAVCRACNTHITFKRLESGKSIALEADGNRHKCAEWRKWRADQG